MNRRRRPRFQNRVLLLTLFTTLPALVTTGLLLWQWDASPALRWVLWSTICTFSVAGAFSVRRMVVHPLRSIASMLESLREGDYSLRGRWEEAADALGEVMVEVNSLSQALYEHRLSAVEAGMLLDKFLAEMDMAVFAFDEDRRLRRINRAGEILFGDTACDLLGRTATELGIDVMLDDTASRIVSHRFPGSAGRWEIRRRDFREGGKPGALLVISDLSRALRDEERRAWSRLIQVLGHELNNSLTPIKSIAGTLRKLLDRKPLPGDWHTDTQGGLAIIHDRAESLGRFMTAYALLARLPAPVRSAVSFGALARRAADLHGALVSIEDSPEVTLDLDHDQMEQVLINLVKNAVEAANSSGGVRIRWRTENGRLAAEVEDDGPGLARTENLWVPFFTTKPGGSGIGLALSREIVENHGGTIALENRSGASGCVARIILPLQGAPA